MAPRYTSSEHHPAVSPLPQPLDGPCLSTGRGAPGTSDPAYCCHNIYLQHGLGHYMQWAGTVQAQGGRGADPAGCAACPTRTWFPKLIFLTTAPPWRIPLRKDLLSHGLGTIWHPRPDLWNLHVWLLDGTRQT